MLSKRISYCFSFSSGENGKLSDRFLFFSSLSCSFFYQRIRPWFRVRLRMLKDNPTGWCCTFACKRPARLSDHMLRAAAWWRKVINGVKNDEEIKVGDGQAVETSVVILQWLKSKRGKVQIQNNKPFSFFIILLYYYYIYKIQKNYLMNRFR